MGLAQAPYFYRFKVGTAEATIVSDGILPLGDPNASFLGIEKAEIARELTENFLPTSNAVLEQNILVLNFGERVVLFDLGMGTSKVFGPTTGKLMATLRQAGIDPASIDALVMSHAHIDHCGGVMADDGTRNFPNAQLYIAQSDFDYWTNDAIVPATYPGARISWGRRRRTCCRTGTGCTSSRTARSSCQELRRSRRQGTRWATRSS